MQVAGAGDPMRRLKVFATASICGHIAATSLGVMSACTHTSGRRRQQCCMLQAGGQRPGPRWQWGFSNTIAADLRLVRRLV